jgi:serine/threonine protein kinase
MGTVYFGVTPDGDRVAVKMIREELTGKSEVRERFDREILVLGMVQGPRVASLLATSGPDEVPPWFATEYVQGLTLTEYVQERAPVPVVMGAVLGFMLAEGLGDIHMAGLLHRDFKPSNILLGIDGPRVIDFGLAALADVTGDITGTSDMLGTPACMAPEQVESPKDLATAADAYALGAVLLFAMTGHYPYNRPTVPAILHAITDPATEPNLSGLPPDIVPLVTGLLAHHPESRLALIEASSTLRAILAAAGLSLQEAQRRFAELTYIERESDPPPAIPAPRSSRLRMPREPHVPSELVRQVAEDLRRDYARGVAL